MKTLQEMVEARSQKSARMTELIGLRTKESRQFTDDEGAEFDTLDSEVSALDDDIRIKRFQDRQAAGATRVQVRLARDEDNLVLTVIDNGSGMAGGPRTGSGIGLVSMRERATALGGQLSIAGIPGTGTTIEVTLPLGRTALEKETA